MAKRKKKVEEIDEIVEDIITDEILDEQILEMDSEVMEETMDAPIEEPEEEVVDTGMVKVLVTANVKYKGVSYKRFEQLSIPAEEAKASKWCTVL